MRVPFIKDLMPLPGLEDVLVIKDTCYDFTNPPNLPSGSIMRCWEVTEIVPGEKVEKRFLGFSIDWDQTETRFITREITPVGPGEITREFRESDWIENIVRKEKRTDLSHEGERK